VQFDPVSAQITGTLQIPGSTGQAAVAGASLYIPFFVPFESDCCDGPLRRAGAAATDAAGIAVIDTQTMTVSSEIFICCPAGYPYSYVTGFAIAPKTGICYVSLLAVSPSTEHYYELLEIDLKTGVPLRSSLIQAGELALSPDGSTLYTTLAGGLFGAISTHTLTVTMSAPGLGIGPFALTPDGDYVYGCTSAGVDIIATSSLSVVGSIPSTSGCSTPIFVEY
jgi:DNA-binding beta-propeller fold protein YncE